MPGEGKKDVTLGVANTVAPGEGDSIAENSHTSSSDSSGLEHLSRAPTRATIHSGRWGEDTQVTGEPVDIDNAIAEFQELRQTLSRRSIATVSGKSKKEADEEEGAAAANADFVDLEDYLKRADRERSAHGIVPKKIGVSFRNLTVSGFGSGWMLVRTFPQELLSLFGWDYVQGLRNKFFGSMPEKKNIIQGFSGVVRPGEMLLVLGKPGSGSSTFLRALTNQRRDFTSIDGDVHYAGLPFELAQGKYRGEILFNDEEDAHLPTLTVDQTVRFALKTKTPAKRLPGTSRKEFVDEMLNLLAKMFGMTHVLNTIVGNPFVRGVSGGERKRVSIMEALASRATINAWDNSTRGLDHVSATDYIKSLRILNHHTHSTTIVTLYQAGEQLYREFDKVCLIDSGRQIFFGKASEARAYFEGLGFDAAPGVTTSDFLTTVTDPTERKIRAGYESKVPLTPEALEQSFRNSKHWTALQEELDAYDKELEASAGVDRDNFSRAVVEDKSRHASNNSPYTVSFPMQVWYLVQRELQLQAQDTTAMKTKFINILVLALILGSIFYDIPRTSEGAFSIGGTVFLSIIVIAWMQMFEGINMALGRNIIAKQASLAFYRPSAIVLARAIADIPSVAIETILFTIILYWMAGLVADAGVFFIHLLFVFTVTICLTAFYRALGAFSKDINVAIRIVFTSLNISALYAGYMQPYPALTNKGYKWITAWIFWVNPLSYAQEAVMANQFHHIDILCSPASLVPNIPGASIANKVCTLPGARSGRDTVRGDDYLAYFEYSHSHLWRNFGIIIGFTVFFLVVAVIGMEVMQFGGSGGKIKILTKPPQPVDEKELPTEKPADVSLAKVSTSAAEKDAAPNSLQPAKSAGSTVKTTGSVYTWRDVNYTIGSGSTSKQLLTDINGYVRPGRLTALMGASGAGKTTLLDTLSMRKRVGVVSGEFLIDGKPLMPDFERSTAFVEQQDVHDWSSTVREALQFSALLRQPQTVSKKEKFEYVENIIKLLELENLADALIGMPGFGLSVEERKRVTIGVELASAPSALLFLDEPTSGLDSNGALSIIRFLRKLADESNIAILCTIHQPSAILFHDFDDLLLLGPGGEQMYFGPTGKNGESVLKYFKDAGAAPALPDANPAEYILETVLEVPKSKHSSWSEIWDASQQREEMLEEIDSLITERKDVPNTHELRTLEYAAPLSQQIIVVTKRTWLHYWRNASYGFSKIFSNVSMGIITGFLFLQLGDSALEMQSRAFAVFVAVLMSPQLFTSTQPMFLEFRMLYEARERNSKIYSAAAWITGMVLAEIPYSILGTIFFFIPWYYMVGFYTDSKVAGYEFFFLMLFEIWVPHIAMWVAAICPDMTIITLVNPFIFVVTNGANGVIVPYAVLESVYRDFVYWANPLTYFVRGMISNVLHDVSVTCSPTELVSFTPPSNVSCGEYAGEWLRGAAGYIVDLDAREVCEYCGFRVGDEFLKTVNMDYDTRWRDLGIFCAFIVSNIVLIYVLYWAFREYRWSRLWQRIRGKRV